MPRSGIFGLGKALEDHTQEELIAIIKALHADAARAAANFSRRLAVAVAYPTNTETK